jgi:hypothetical protein
VGAEVDAAGLGGSWRGGASLRRACGMRLLPSLWFPHLPPANYHLRRPVCHLPSAVYRFTPLFSSTSWDKGYNLLLFNNIVENRKIYIFSPFVFNNIA